MDAHCAVNVAVAANFTEPAKELAELFQQTNRRSVWLEDKISTRNSKLYRSLPQEVQRRNRDLFDNARPGHTGNYRPFVFTLKEDIVGISARNQLNGKITEIVLGDVMAHITVRVGQNLIESVITRKSADELKLKKGDAVTVTVKATEVMIAKGE
jgi:molybdopterin-binding protein